METIGCRIKARRKALGLTQKQLAELAGVSSTSIVYWERDETQPKSLNLAELSRALDCAPDFLMYGANFGDDLISVPIKARVPLISWVQAGHMCEGTMLDPTTAESWLYCPTNCSEKTYALIVRGDSMTSPHPGVRSYPEGIIIFIDPLKDAVHGSRVIAKKVDSNEATFKTYVEDSGDSFLKPINPQYPIIKMDDRFTICGVVIGSYMPE